MKTELIQPLRKAILALDIATLSGYCLWDIEKGQPVTAGTLDNSIRTKATKTIPVDPRNLRLWKFYDHLDKTLKLAQDLGLKVTVVSHESITQGRAAGGKTAEVARHLEATCHLWCHNRLKRMPLQYACGTIKKHGTGMGNCEKEAMMQSAEASYPILVHQLKAEGQFDDNVADALHLASLTAHRL